MAEAMAAVRPHGAAPAAARRGVALVAAALASFGCARLGFAFAPAHPEAALVRPVVGVAIALVMLLGPIALPVVAAGVLGAALAAGAPPLVAALLAAAALVEAGAGAWAFRRIAGEGDGFGRGRDVFRFAVAAVPVTFAGGVLAAAAIVGGGQAAPARFVALAAGQWAGGLVGMLLLLPPVMLVARGERPAWSSDRWIELGMLFGGLVLLGRATFAPLPWVPFDRAPIVVALPFLIWAATRFGPRETAIASLVFAGFVAWGTEHGRGPFAMGDRSAGLLLFAFYAAVVSTTMLGIAAMLRYQHRIEAAVRDAFGELGMRLERQSADLARAVVRMRGAVRARTRVRRVAGAVVGALVEPLLVLDGDLRVRAANPAFHRFFGLPVAATRGRRLWELDHAAWDVPALRTVLERASTGPGDVQRAELTHDFPRLGQRTLRVSATRIARGRGVSRRARLVLAFEDVSERRRAEVELRASEERFRAVAETAMDAIVIADVRDRVTYLNDAARRLFGWTTIEAVGRSLATLVPALARDAASSPAAVEAPRTFEAVGLRRDGRSVPLEVSLAGWSAGGRNYRTLIARDVSRRKTAEANAQLSEAQLERAQALAHVGSWTWDSRTRRIRASGEMFRIFGLEPSAESQGEHEFLGRVHPRDRARLLDAIRQALETGQTSELDYRIVRPNSTIRWLHGLTAAGPGPDGARVVSGVANDITARKLSERKMRRLNTELEQRVRERTAELERSNLELQQFAYIAAHDLQEPLRTVAAYTQLLARRYRGRLDPEADEFIDYATDGAVWMHRLIEDLLVYSRVGAAQIRLEEVDADAVAARALINLQQAIEEQGATVRRGVLPRVQGDANQLTLLFQNLIANAIKFRRRDVSPDIDIRAERRGDEWEFTVRDNGLGIAPRSLHRIFDIFQRLHTREEYPGTGIGLAVCKKIVERHGGRIWAESEPGRGSIFHFTLPAGPAVRRRGREADAAQAR